MLRLIATISVTVIQIVLTQIMTLVHVSRVAAVMPTTTLRIANKPIAVTLVSMIARVHLPFSIVGSSALVSCRDSLNSTGHHGSPRHCATPIGQELTTGARIEGVELLDQAAHRIIDGGGRVGAAHIGLDPARFNHRRCNAVGAQIDR